MVTPSRRKASLPAGLLAVEMRVDEVPDGLLRHRRDGGLDLVVERRELAVHHDDAVTAHRDRDVAALAFQHIGHVAEVGGLDLDLREIRLLGIGRRCGQQRGAGERDPFCGNQVHADTQGRTEP
jgi:hypothetical protein